MAMSLQRVREKLKEKKVLSTTLILVTLAIGILLGTLISSGVKAARQAAGAPDATPLAIPPPTQASSSFAQIAKRIGPAVVNINTESVIKASRPQQQQHCHLSDCGL